MKRILTILLLSSLIIFFFGCSNTATIETEEEIAEDENIEVIAEELEGIWEGTATGETNLEYTIMLTLNEDGTFTYQEADVDTSEENQELLKGDYLIDDDLLVLNVEEDQDLPNVFIIGNVNTFEYEISTNSLVLINEDGEIFNFSREGINQNQ